MTTEIKNVQIVDTFLGGEDHGIFTFSLQLDDDGCRYSFGNYCLSYHNCKIGKDVFNPKGLEAIAKTLKVVDVSNWEELKWKYARIKIEDHKVVAIGNIIKNEWFDIQEFFKIDEEN